MKEFNERKFNRLCAELLGYVNTTPTDKDFNIHEHPETKKMIETNFTNVFTEDWNWIMAVVEKILSLDIVEDFESWYDKESKIHSCSISFTKPLPITKTGSITSRSKESKKEAYVKAIWWFFDICNKNKSIS